MDWNDKDQAAMKAAMPMLAEHFSAIGWEKRLCDLTEEEVMQAIEIVAIQITAPF
jgi:hypothetical protein